MRAALVLILGILASVLSASVTLTGSSRDAADQISETQPLPKIAPAPQFTLTSQDGKPIALADLRGKVVAVTFIFTLCSATCPVLTPMMSLVQDRLGRDFGTNVAFVSITVDPDRDTPDVLKLYAQMHSADVPGWSFLTGEPATVQEVIRRYGVFASKAANGDVEHSFLTSIIDRRGVLRVQYLGVRFDPEEFRRDLISLLRER
jgi:protein SCO1/2